MKTYAPSATNRLAVARPIPLLPPVTTATLPLSFPLIVITPYLVLSNVTHIRSIRRSGRRVGLRWRLAAFREFAAQRNTGARRARHQPPLLVENVAFHQAHDFTGTNHAGFGA